MTVNERVIGSESDSDEQAHDERAVLTGQESPRLTVAAVARRLGVAPATLRTWDRRYGLGPSEHTAGHHRRYGPGDVERLEQMQRALLRGASPAEAARYAHATTQRATEGEATEGGATERVRHGRDPDDSSSESPRGREDDPASAGDEPVLLSGVLDGSDEGEVLPETDTNPGGRGLRLGRSGPRARGLGRAVLALDSRSAQQILGESIRADGVVATRREVLRPVLRALAERRQRSGSGAEMLQLLDDCALTALRAVIAQAPAPLNPRPVVLASVPGEARELDLVALAAALAQERVGHRLFGPALPKEGLDAAIRRAAPAAVVLWAEQSHYADPDLIADIPNPRQRVRAFAAGPGWTPEAMPGHVDVLDSWEAAVERVGDTVLGRKAAWS